MAFSRSLVPSLRSRNWWDTWDVPPYLYDQDFALGLLEQDLIPSRPRYFPRTFSRSLSATPGRRTGISEVRNDPNKYQVLLDVSHFSPEEISVKTIENSIVIKGKHEERPDQHGFISREFTRRYELPAEVDPATVTSSLSPDGVLTVEAPKKAIEPLPPNERQVPITLQNVPNAPALRESVENVPQAPSEPGK